MRKRINRLQIKFFILCIALALVLIKGEGIFSDVQAVKWRFQTVVAPGDDIVKIWRMFGDQVSKYSEGNITIEFLLAGSSGVAQQQYVAAYGQGLVECGDLTPFMYPGELGEWVGIPSLLSWVYRNPHAVVETAQQARALYEEALRKRGIVVLSMLNAVMSSDGVTPIFSRKRLKDESDFKGLRMRVPGKVQEEYIWKKIGVNALTLPISEVYLAMSRGLCDAVKSGTQRLMALRVHEIAKYVYIDSYVGTFQPSFIVCSQRAYDSLSPQQREALLKAGREIETLYWREIFWNPGKFQIGSEVDALKEAKSKGLTVEMLPDTLIDRLRRLAESGITELGEKSGSEGKRLIQIVEHATKKHQKLESPILSFLKGSQ